jgi:hypothetical protein
MHEVARFDSGARFIRSFRKSTLSYLTSPGSRLSSQSATTRDVESRKLLALEQLHAAALLGDERGHGGARRASADHDDIWIVPFFNRHR